MLLSFYLLLELSTCGFVDWFFPVSVGFQELFYLYLFGYAFIHIILFSTFSHTLQDSPVVYHYSIIPVLVLCYFIVVCNFVPAFEACPFKVDKFFIEAIFTLFSLRIAKASGPFFMFNARHGLE